MSLTAETRQRGQALTGSQKSFSGGNISEIAQNPLIFNQAAWIAARYSVGAAHARVIAEHVFARRPQR